MKPVIEGILGVALALTFVMLLKLGHEYETAPSPHPTRQDGSTGPGYAPRSGKVMQ